MLERQRAALRPDGIGVRTQCVALAADVFLEERVPEGGGSTCRASSTSNVSPRGQERSSARAGS